MLTKENIKGLASLVDDAIKFKNPILEAIDGPTIKGVVTLVDNQLFDKIPEEYHQNINEMVSEILEKDYEQAVTELMELISQILTTYVFPPIPSEED